MDLAILSLIFIFIFQLVISIFLSLLINHFIIRKLRNPPVLFWDLDYTLIRSSPRKWYANKELPKVPKIVSVREIYFRHIDDDFCFYKTYIRPYSRVVLYVCSFFCDMYVCTSATRGYMVNILKVMDPFEKYFIKSWSRCDFRPKFFSERGKDFHALFRTIGKEKEIDLKRFILIDDKGKYHSANPRNGILMKRFFGGERKSEGDWELLKVLLIILRCWITDDVRKVLPNYHPLRFRESYEKLNQQFDSKNKTE